jgi:RNA polymerase sigma-70 factor, ECF subfamily
MTPWTRHQHAHHWPRMVKLARRYVGENDAEDVAATALSRAIRSEFRGDSELATWLHRIVINTAISGIRAERRRPTQVDMPELSHADTPEAVAIRDERHRALYRAIGRLSEPYREALGLYLRLDSYPEIARTTGLPEGTVKSRINRAREALRRET